MKAFVTAVRDYHEYSDVLRHFKNAGVDLKYIDVGCGPSELVVSGRRPNQWHHAVFYQPEDENTHYKVELVKQWVQRLRVSDDA